MAENEAQKPQRPANPNMPPNGGDGGGGGGGGGGGLVVTYPAQYTITLENFHVDQTWSFHNDTDYVDFGVLVDGHPALNSPQHKYMGDLSGRNETYNVGISYTISVPSADTPVVINYQIVNNGHGDPGQIMSALDSGSDNMGNDPSIGTDMTNDPSTDTGNSDSVWSQILASALNAIGGWLVNVLTAKCDATVAASQIRTTGNELASFTTNGNYTKSKRFTKSSPSGCGTSDADYTVTWSATRTDAQLAAERKTTKGGSSMDQ